MWRTKRKKKKKKKRALEIIGHHWVYQHMPYGSPRRKVRQRAERGFETNKQKNSPKLPKFNVRHPYTHQIQQTPTRINKKRDRAWYIIIKLSKVRQREPWKQQELSDPSHYMGSSIRLSFDFLQKLWRPEGIGITYSKCWKKILSIKNSISKQTTTANYLSKIKEK